jgi:hypothetical protein
VTTITQKKIPKVAVAAALGVIKSSVRKRAHFNLDELNPAAHASQCFIPALFAAATGDDFIAPRHAEAIHADYAGDKNLITFDGDHNSNRPAFYFGSCGIFLHNCLRGGDRDPPVMPSTRRSHAHPLRFRKRRLTAAQMVVPPPEHEYGYRNPGLAEIYLRV